MLAIAARDGQPVERAGVTPLTDERRRRVKELAVDRSKVPGQKALQATPPEALAGDERIQRWRDRHDSMTRLEALRRWWTRAKRRHQIAREPIPRKS